jgi:hypothetical protein
MARIPVDPNYNSPTFPRATAATDLFLKEDVQALAAAMSTHDHSTGKGVVLGAASIPNGTITSAMIADLTIDTADLKDGAVTSAKILDGTIATGDLANSAVTNAKLGTDTARLNLLTNPGFEVWQRGNGPFAVNGPSADRWSINGSGTILSVSRNTANTDAASLACAACTVTAYSAEMHLSQRQEDVTQLHGRTITFSARVRTSTASAVRLSVGQDSGLTYGSYHSGGGAYETLTVTAVIAVNATIASPNVTFNANCTAYVDNAMLVVGSVPADYAPLHPADDLARCLRYYRRYAATSTIGIGLGQAISAVNAVHHFLMSPRTAVTPTATVSAPGDWWATAASSTGIACTNLVGSILHPDACTLQSTVASGLVAGNASYLQNNNGNSTISFEANP